MGKRNWDKIRRQPVTDTIRNRDVYDTQQLDRTKVGQKQTFTSRHIAAIGIGLFVAILVWAVWSYFDIARLDNEAATDANMAVVITQPAPDEPRDYADVKWANMLLVKDDTYASYGYTYADVKTGIKYTQAEYDIWLDVHRRINNKECPELLHRTNADGTRTYVERDPIEPAPEEPRTWSHATALNFWSRGIVEDARYRDLGYAYCELYTNTPLTEAEYESLKKYKDRDYVVSLINDGYVTFQKEDIVDQNGIIRTVSKYSDIKSDVIAIDIPTEKAGERYTTPIELDDVTYANMRLVADNSASKLGYSYRDERTGKFYTLVEYEKWKSVRNDAIYGNNGLILWIDISDDDGQYVFAAKPPAKASSVPRERFSEYLNSTLMKMNMTKDDRFWADYGYIYYDKYSRMFYSEAEYQVWLNVQKQVADGFLRVPQKTQTEIRNNNINVTNTILTHLDPLPVKHTFSDGFVAVTTWKAVLSLGAGTIIYLLLKTILKRNLDAQNAMNDTSDINQYENDQHIALPEEIQRKFDWFPDAGAHCPVQVSSMISHVMITNKGLNKIKLAKRADKDIVDEDGDIIQYKGEIIVDDDGEPITETVPLIDSEFADALYEASGSPKEVRKYYDPTKIPYNADGKDRTKQCGTHKTVADAINSTWELPLYEPQRPAGAFLVDTEPVNTMVLAITRAGKGQTVIEPTIDMWTRETRPNNMVINDPKGELLVKNYVRGTVRGFQIVQFNLINSMKTDIYNPLGMAAESAREGDFTKCAMYVDNIAGVFFPVDGADDPVWPNAANNAFKRAAYGLIDYYLEEEKELRREAERVNLDPKVLDTKLDQMWGKVTLYNCYQLFVQLTSKKLKNPKAEIEARVKIAQDYYNSFGSDVKDEDIPPHSDPEVQKLIEMDSAKFDAMYRDAIAKSALWDGKDETDLLSLFFTATDVLPRNSMRNLVANANNALKSMAGAEKMLASVYGIAITAMVRRVAC